MYSGNKVEQYQEHVKILNNVCLGSLPACLTKGRMEEWTGVHPDFPEPSFALNLDAIRWGIDAVKFINNGLLTNKIDPTKEGTKAEKDCMKNYEITKNFFSIMEQRIITRDLCNNVLQSSRDIVDREEEIQFRLYQHVTASVEEQKNIEDALKQEYESWIDIRDKYTDSLYEFETACQKLKMIERKENKNFFLNKDLLIKEKLKDVEGIKDKMKNVWMQTFKDLREQILSSRKDPVDNKQNETKIINETKNKNVEKKITYLGKISKEVEETRVNLSQRGLEGALKTLEKVTDELKYEDLNKDQEKIMFMAKALIRDLGRTIDEKIKENKINEERKRIELNSNIRSMGHVELPKLYGIKNWYQWRKAQNFLNTHSDPYKKASVLYNSLTNWEDKESCKNVFNFDDMMRELATKYEDPEREISVLKEELRALPKAHDDKRMMVNITVILNKYKQFKDRGIKALNRFDTTLVDDLARKLPYLKNQQFHTNCIKELDSFKMIDEMTGKELNLLEGEADETGRKRQFFIKFLQETQLVYNRSTPRENEKIDIRKSTNLKKPDYKFKPKKHSVYNVVDSPVFKCLPCGAKEAHKNKFNKPTKSLGQCPEFKKWNIAKRKSYVKDNHICWICLVPGHRKDQCRIQAICKSCPNQQRHHPLICEKQVKQEQVNCVECVQVDGNVRLRFSEAVLVNKRQTAEVKQVIIIVMYDPGATPNLIRREKARQCHYKRVNDEKVVIKGLFHGRAVRLPVYELEILDRQNKAHTVRAYGVEDDMMPSYNYALDDKTINHYSKVFNVKRDKINNPIPNKCKRIDLLLGEAEPHLHSRDKEIRGKTKMSISKLGRNYVLSGVVKELDQIYDIPKSNDPDIYKDDSKRMTLQQYLRYSQPRKEVITHIETSPDYWTGDQLGLNVLPKCITCLKSPKCKECAYLNQPLSIKEQKEGQLIRESVTFDEKNNTLRVAYPYLNDPKQMFPKNKTNYDIAAKMAYNLLKGLRRDGLTEQYTEAFLDMENRGAMRELSPQELQEWNGPVNYTSHHAVLKNSKSTACRSVCNSSLKNNGTSLNEQLPKGPKSISNLLHVLMRFRSCPYILIADLSKAYQVIKTSILDCHLRRLLWFRKEDLKEEHPELRTFGMTSVAFGDTPSAYYLETAKMLVAEKLKKDGQQKLSEEILRSSYVDDFCLPCETKSQVNEYQDNMPKAFNHFGFTIKEFIIGGEGEKDTTELLFGHLYKVKQDRIQLKFVVNFSSRKRSQKTGSDLTSKFDLTKLTMNKRKFMSLLASQYDPLGLASVFLAKYKIFMSKIYKCAEYHNFDQEFNEADQKQAIVLVREMILASENPITFNRGTKLEGYYLKRLIVFTDASVNCLQVVIYGLFQNSKGEVLTSLICGKNKICGSTVPRNELQALVAGHRLVMNFITAMDEKYLENLDDITFLTDSTIVCDTLQKTYQGKDIYILNRVSEIYNTVRKMNKNVKYFWIRTQLNISDQGTRDNCKYEFLQTKEWQEGPEFIKDVEKEAELKLELNKENIKDECIYKIETTKEEIFNPVIGELIKKYKRFYKVLRIYANVRWWRKLTYLKKEGKLESDEEKMIAKNENYEETKLYLLGLCKPSEETVQGLKRQYYVDTDDESNVSLISRPYTLNDKVIQDKMVLLDFNDISKGLLNDLHIHTSNIEREFAKMIDQGYFVVGSRKYFRKLQQTCYTCKRIRQEAIKVKMGPSMSVEASKCAPFTHAFSDIKGPIWTKLTRNVRKKIWILTVTDIFTRFTVFTLLIDMTANSVLQGLKTIAYSVGGAMPVYLYTDWGTNYVPIKNINENVNDEPDEKLSVNELSNTLGANNIQLILSSAKAPWRQGSVEAMHKIFIRSMKRTNLVSKSYNITEWVHILAFITYQVNMRPLTLKVSDSLLVLTPMKLIFGRTRVNNFTTQRMSINIQGNKLYERVAQLENELNAWKKLYSDTYLLECKRSNKWKTDSRILVPGDVVLVLDHFNKTTGFPTIGQVKEAVSERTYLLTYVKKDAQISTNNKIVKGAVLGELTRPAQGLSFICGANEEGDVNLEPRDSGDDVVTNLNQQPELQLVDNIETVDDKNDIDINDKNDIGIDDKNDNLSIPKRQIKLNLVKEKETIKDINRTQPKGQIKLQLRKETDIIKDLK